MRDVYLVVWSGGYDTPQYQACKTDVEAWGLAEMWRGEREPEDTIDVLRINGNDLTVECLGTL